MIFSLSVKRTTQELARPSLRPFTGPNHLPARHFSPKFVEEIQQEGHVGRALVLGRRFGRRSYRKVFAVRSEGGGRVEPELPDLLVGPQPRFVRREPAAGFRVIRDCDARASPIEQFAAVERPHRIRADAAS